MQIVLTPNHLAATVQKNAHFFQHTCVGRLKHAVVLVHAEKRGLCLLRHIVRRKPCPNIALITRVLSALSRTLKRLG